MNNKITKLLLTTLVGLVCLSGCNDTSTSSVVSIDENTTSIKDAISKLASCQNFTTLTRNVNSKVVYSRYEYNPSYFRDILNNEGYLLKDNDVYTFSIVEEEIKNGELISDKELYGPIPSGLVYDFSCIDLSYIDDDVKTFSTLKRTTVQPLLYIAGFSSVEYSYLDSVNITLDGDTVGDLKVEFLFTQSGSGGGTSTYSYLMELLNVNETNNEIVLDYIANGNISDVDADLKRIRSLFELDNYTQIQYDGENFPFQYDYFTKDYYINVYTNSYIELNPLAQYQQKAYMSILEPDRTLDLLKDSSGNPIPLIYNDTYMFSYYGSYENQQDVILVTRNDPNNPGYAQGAFTQKVVDVPTALHYPKGLDLFTSLEKLNKVEQIEGLDVYETNDESLIENFLADYSLTGAFDDYGGIEYLQIMYQLFEEDQDCLVKFRLLTPDGGYYDIEYVDFGNTSFEPLQKIRDENNLTNK